MAHQVPPIFVLEYGVVTIRKLHYIARLHAPTWTTIDERVLRNLVTGRVLFVFCFQTSEPLQIHVEEEQVVPLRTSQIRQRTTGKSRKTAAWALDQRSPGNSRVSDKRTDHE